MDLNITGKTILVTGAAKGIGKSIALACANEGANVVLHYNNSNDGANETAEEIKKLNSKVMLVKADLSSFAEVKDMKTAIDKEFGTLYGIVNNAGYTKYKSFFDYSPGEWNKEIEVCFHGVLHLAYNFLPDMKKEGEGKFINIVGDSARTGERNLVISSAARNGTISLLKSLAKEVGKQNLQLNTISLGLIQQDEAYDEAILKKIVRQYPLNRLGTTEDISGTALFLLSSWSNWITGQVIPINGGYSMMG